MSVALSPEHRSAQRKLVGTLSLKKSMWFEPGAGLCIWRDERSTEWGAGIPELASCFDTLGIPYIVRAELLTVGKAKQAGFTLVVPWGDLDALTRWVPSFQRQIDNALASIDES